MRILDKATQDKAEETYFTLLDQTLAALNDTGISCELTNLWFRMQLLKLSGHTPNLKTDESGKKLAESKYYVFDFEKTRFVPSKNGEFDAAAIKFLRLGFVAKSPKILAQIKRAEEFIPLTKTFTRTLLQSFVRV
jgi:recombinational DNA repair protein (RecF pathway)